MKIAAPRIRRILSKTTQANISFDSTLQFVKIHKKKVNNICFDKSLYGQMFKGKKGRILVIDFIGIFISFYIDKSLNRSYFSKSGLGFINTLSLEVR